MSDSAAQDGVERQLPIGDEIFLDHVGHFVSDAEAATRALIHCGFAPTPISIQVDAAPDGSVRPAGTGNVTAMLERGYLEVLFKTSDTPLSRELDAAVARHPGVHLAAFAVAKAEQANRQLAVAGFPVRGMMRLQRPVETGAGMRDAAFTIARVEPGAMPEGRIQMLTHHTEDVLWQKRWLSHPNTATGLIDVIIAVADVAEAARRFARFTGREARPTPPGGALIRFDRGGVNIVSHELATVRLPEVSVTSLPFILGYALRVNSLAAAEAAVDGADLEWRALDYGIVASFPPELGQGAWFFVERASALPWR